jgi:aminodeoxychorismate lyase
MIVFLNGKFVPEERAVISVFDRGFLYGDGLYEGILFVNGRPFRWDEHMKRLWQGVKFLKLTVPFSSRQLQRFALQLVRRNKMPECLLRLSLSRGITERGYSPKNAVHPAIVMTLHPVPPVNNKNLPRWRAIIAQRRLPANDPLTAFKTANKLPQVLAKAQADAAGANEAILLNDEGRLAEGTTCNVFWIKGGTVFTPPLPDGPLPGVTRAAVMELCVKMNLRCKERKGTASDLHRAEGVFLTMTSWGVVELASLDGSKLRRSSIVAKIREAYCDLLQG